MIFIVDSRREEKKADQGKRKKIKGGKEFKMKRKKHERNRTLRGYGLHVERMNRTRADVEKS